MRVGQGELPQATGLNKGAPTPNQAPDIAACTAQDAFRTNHFLYSPGNTCPLELPVHPSLPAGKDTA